MLALAAAALSFTGPASLVSPSAVVARTDVQMNTKYTVAAGMAKKKGNTGQSKSLWGYTVGSRAPDTAVSSGTTKSGQGLWEKLFSKPTEYKQTAGMNTRDTGPKAKNKAQTGDTRLLNGYKVGMRDPNGYGAGIGGGLKRTTKRI